MHDISVFDESFDLKNTFDYSLFIQLLPDGFTYSVYDDDNNIFLGLRHFYFGENFPSEYYRDTAETIINGEEILVKKFKNINLLYYSGKSTFIPQPLFQHDKIADYYRLNFSTAENEEILFNRFKNIPAVCVYGVDSMVYSLFNEKYSNLNLFHQSIPQIDPVYQFKKNKLKDPEVFVCFNTEFFNLYVLHENDLKYYNSFVYNTKEDVIYYILYAFENLKLDPEKTQIELSGDIEINSDICEWLKKYIRDIQLAEKPLTVNYSHVLKQIPGHYFVNLFNLVQCV
ncbi:MAG: DUF3822 family protein [Marinilabiliales bacterium]